MSLGSEVGSETNDSLETHSPLRDTEALHDRDKWEKQAASVDQRQVDLVRREWTLFREQIGALTHQLSVVQQELGGLKSAETKRESRKLDLLRQVQWIREAVEGESATRAKEDQEIVELLSQARQTFEKDARERFARNEETAQVIKAALLAIEAEKSARSLAVQGLEVRFATLLAEQQKVAKVSLPAEFRDLPVAVAKLELCSSGLRSKIDAAALVSGREAQEFLEHRLLELHQSSVAAAKAAMDQRLLHHAHARMKSVFSRLVASRDSLQQKLCFQEWRELLAERRNAAANAASECAKAAEALRDCHFREAFVDIERRVKEGQRRACEAAEASSAWVDQRFLQLAQSRLKSVMMKFMGQASAQQIVSCFLSWSGLLDEHGRAKVAAATQVSEAALERCLQEVHSAHAELERRLLGKHEEVKAAANQGLLRQAHVRMSGVVLRIHGESTAALYHFCFESWHEALEEKRLAKVAAAAEATEAKLDSRIQEANAATDRRFLQHAHAILKVESLKLNGDTIAALHRLCFQNWSDVNDEKRRAKTAAVAEAAEAALESRLQNAHDALERRLHEKHEEVKAAAEAAEAMLESRLKEAQAEMELRLHESHQAGKAATDQRFLQHAHARVRSAFAKMLIESTAQQVAFCFQNWSELLDEKRQAKEAAASEALLVAQIGLERRLGEAAAVQAAQAALENRLAEAQADIERRLQESETRAMEAAHGARKEVDQRLLHEKEARMKFVMMGITGQSSESHQRFCFHSWMELLAEKRRAKEAAAAEAAAAALESRLRETQDSLDRRLFEAQSAVDERLMKVAASRMRAVFMKIVGDVAAVHLKLCFEAWRDLSNDLLDAKKHSEAEAAEASLESRFRELLDEHKRASSNELSEALDRRLLELKREFLDRATSVEVIESRLLEAEAIRAVESKLLDAISDSSEQTRASCARSHSTIQQHLDRLDRDQKRRVSLWDTVETLKWKVQEQNARIAQLASEQEQLEGTAPGEFVRERLEAIGQDVQQQRDVRESHNLAINSLRDFLHAVERSQNDKQDALTRDVAAHDARYNAALERLVVVEQASGSGTHERLEALERQGTMRDRLDAMEREAFQQESARLWAAIDGHDVSREGRMARLCSPMRSTVCIQIEEKARPALAPPPVILSPEPYVTRRSLPAGRVSSVRKPTVG